MGTLKELTERVLRLLPDEMASDAFYLGHHCNIKKVPEGGDSGKHVRFPVCLAVQHDEEPPIVYEDFALNISRGATFIETETPLPTGSELTLHFYIPPEKKLLAEFKGRVTASNSGTTHPHGMYIELYNWTSDALQQLEDYLDEHRHLVDQTA